MQAYRAVGSYKFSNMNYRHESQDFKIEVAAMDEKDAVHQIMSNIGSRHRILRKDIFISQMTALKNEEVTNLIVKHLTGGHK
jgi:ribosomal protein L20A (L18A)